MIILHYLPVIMEKNGINLLYIHAEMNGLKYFDVDDYFNLVLVGKHLHVTYNNDNNSNNS